MRLPGLSLRLLSLGILLGAVISGCASAQTGSSGSTAGGGPAGGPSVATPGPGSQAPGGSTRVGDGFGIIKGPLAGEAKKLTGAGATFPAPLYTKWFNEYQKLGGVEVNYQAIGSGGGIKAISDSTVDFGASDAPLTDDQLKALNGPAFHIPMALGGIVPVYNIPEIGQAKLRFTPETLAGIFLGTIAKWNDPMLAADNPGISFPNKEIVTVHRSDGSGTTFVFTEYLSNVSTEWKSKVGSATSVNWPNGLGGSGNAGVAGEVKQSPHSIGYVEYTYAVQNKIAFGQMKNKAGNWMDASAESVSAAATDASLIPSDLRFSIVNSSQPQAWPISSATWQVVPANWTDKAKAIAYTRLAWWSIHEGQDFTGALGYAPLPPELVTRAEAFIQKVKVDGQPVFPNR